VRAHFFNTIHIAVLILCIGAPPNFSNLVTLRTLWFICATVQALLTQSIYGNTCSSHAIHLR
jgi:hypothetical protein